MGALVRSLPGRLPGLPAPGPALRRRLGILAIVFVALVAAFQFWLRDSDLVAVETVTISGAEERPELTSKLESAALDQTTLHVDEGALEAAIAGDPAVLGLSASADFPHGLEIDVQLRDPVGYIASTGAVVAGDGVVLEQVKNRPEGVAAIEIEDGKVGTGAALDGNALLVAKALGPAPEPLLEQADSARMDAEHGVVVTLGEGIELRFGDRLDPDLKWRAAAAVLADPELTTASYIDLSVPDRPVVGGVPTDPQPEPEG